MSRTMMMNSRTSRAVPCPRLRKINNSCRRRSTSRRTDGGAGEQRQRQCPVAQPMLSRPSCISSSRCCCCCVVSLFDFSATPTCSRSWPAPTIRTARAATAVCRPPSAAPCRCPTVSASDLDASARRQRRQARGHHSRRRASLDLPLCPWPCLRLQAPLPPLPLRLQLQVLCPLLRLWRDR